MKTNSFLQNLFEFLDLKVVSIKQGHQPVPDLSTNTICFENVNFSYANSEKKVLQHINLEARNNEVISLVGKNGAGKTTLIKLLCRLL